MNLTARLAMSSWSASKLSSCLLYLGTGMSLPRSCQPGKTSMRLLRSSCKPEFQLSAARPKNDRTRHDGAPVRSESGHLAPRSRQGKFWLISLSSIRRPVAVQDSGRREVHRYLPLRFTTLPLSATPAMRLPAPHTYSDSLLVTMFL